RFVQEGATALDCSPDLIAVPLLSFVAAALGRRVAIVAKQDFVEHAAHWSVVAARPGAAKSPPPRPAAIGLRARPHQTPPDHKAALAKWAADVFCWEQTSPKDRTDLKPTRPRKPSYIMSDTTWEALVPAIEQMNGVALVQDELRAWIRGQDAYRGSQGFDRA